MVKVNSSALILIGGIQDGWYYSSRTHILDLTNQKWSDGPELKSGRLGHSCAIIPTNSQSSGYSVIVVGGFDGHDMSSVEILDEGTNEWRQGPELPHPICCSAAVEHPLGGVALIGGLLNDSIYQLSHAGEDAKWELLPQKLKIPRYQHLAFVVQDELVDYC